MARLASRSRAVGRPPPAPCDADWQSALADAVRDPAELCRLLGLPPSLAVAARRAAGRFPLLVPRGFVARIHPNDPKDPLLAQVLPKEEELAATPGYHADPLRESAVAASPGLLRKYRGRSLMVATGACAVHCRFCFRRCFPYRDLPRELAGWEPALRRIAAERSIHEVILSGGDPLALSDDRLARLARRLAEIPHLRRLRIHTRLPIMVPQRVGDALLGWVRGSRLVPMVVVHVNHPAEIDDAVAAALGRLVDAGVPVLNQSVLLRGVNDRVEVLHRLCERLVDLRVMPYYLHQLDRVAGTAHFVVPEADGIRLVQQLRTRLPGYAVPRYVREMAGTPSKQALA